MRQSVVWLHLGLFFIPAVASLQAALIEIALPSHDLAGIADVIERRDVTLVLSNFWRAGSSILGRFIDPPANAFAL